MVGSKPKCKDCRHFIYTGKNKRYGKCEIKSTKSDLIGFRVSSTAACKKGYEPK